jgi:hypothetical protein
MGMTETAVTAQLLLLAYHQTTTLVDLYPFNGVRNFKGRERFIESAVNCILMGLPPIGYAFHIAGLMACGAVYYFILFFIELIVWWVPYVTEPAGIWRRPYNFLLAMGNGDFAEGDTLARWYEQHKRLFKGTIRFLPARGERPVPNLEHCILHAWTLVTAIVTTLAYAGQR